jgi:hypothetical protein
MRFKQLSLTMAFVMGVEAIARDSGVSGPRLELIHEYYDEWPDGYVQLRDFPTEST